MKSGRCLDRPIPFGDTTAEALLAYLGNRERHPLANDADVWLANSGTQPSYDGLVRGLRRRAPRADVKDFRPHRLRHTAAHRWLAAGGFGAHGDHWLAPADMLVRYTCARASERAAKEARRLNLGAL